MKKRRLALLALVLLLAAGAAWYARPVGIYELYPGMEVDAIAVSLTRYGAGRQMDHRDLRLEPGDPDFAGTLARLEALRFRRPPTNLLLLAFPSLQGSDSIRVEEGDFDFLIAFEQSGHETWRGDLGFWIGDWYYRDLERTVTLSLLHPDAKETGKALARELWDLATPQD